MARNAVHSALFLISSLYQWALSSFCWALNSSRRRADSGLRGGVMVLFLFVIMLLMWAPKKEGRARFSIALHRLRPLTFFVAARPWIAARDQQRRLAARRTTSKLCKQRLRAARGANSSAGRHRRQSPVHRNRASGNSLFTSASPAIEIASLLLLVAIIGSVMLARTLKQEAAADDVDPDELQTVLRWRASRPNGGRIECR